MSLIGSLRERWSAFILREKQKTEKMTTKEKISYFVTYYKLEAFCVLLVIGIVVFSVRCIINLNKKCILYVGLVDISMTEESFDRFCEDYKLYVQDDDSMHYVTLDYPLYSSGALIPEDLYKSDTTYQEKAILLLGSGLVDAYICPQQYLDFLILNDDVSPVREILGDELSEKFADRVTPDGKAVLLPPSALASYTEISYEPCYLVFTYNNHFPEVTAKLLPFLMES